MKRKSDRHSSRDKEREKKRKHRSRDRTSSRDRSRSRDRKKSRDRYSREKRRSRSKERRERSRSKKYSKYDRDVSKESPKEKDKDFTDCKAEFNLSQAIALNIQKSMKDYEKKSDSLNNDLSRKSRKSRWSANELDKCIIAGMPTTIPSNMKSEDADVYVLQLEIAEITNKLKKQNYTSEIEAMRRLPSPDPVYGPDGKRINTKEFRARERLEDRRRQMLEKLAAIRPDLVPQSERITTRYEEKVFIPQEEYPDINFAGLIIGPRGMTQKELEKETGTRIILRGKGSVKCGKITVNTAPLPGEDEPLHAFITSTSKENVQKAVEKVRKIIEDGIQFPELENDLRKNQMKQLAILNGTYRETDGLNKLKMLGEAQTIATNTIICSLCGGTGHLPRDCKVNADPSAYIYPPQRYPSQPQEEMPPAPPQFSDPNYTGGHILPPPPPPPPQMAIPPLPGTHTAVDGEYCSFISELGAEAQMGSYYYMPPYTGGTGVGVVAGVPAGCYPPPPGNCDENGQKTGHF